MIIAPPTRCEFNYATPVAINFGLAAAAALMMGQTSEGIPVVIIGGLDYEKRAKTANLSPLGWASSMWDKMDPARNS
ncbi:MAG: hypothetical protein ABSF36_02430 [Candidatus Methanomethylicaceae archaeon]